LYGPAYKGISLVTATAGSFAVKYGLDFPLSFNRKEPKDHGDGERILGYVPKDGDRIAIVEDVITAGTSIRETRDLFNDLRIDVKIVALYVSVDRMERGTGDLTAIEQLKKDMGIEVYAIATAKDIIDYLECPPKGSERIVDADKHADKMRTYLKEYGKEGIGE
jgi:orotate phosphoribosyltransferase